jgi:hypothetical protein
LCDFANKFREKSMPAIKRLRAPLIVMFGVIMAVTMFAGPANATGSYPPPAGTTVLGTSASVVPATQASTATSGLAFTGANAIGLGTLGGLLLVGGGAMVLVGKRRKVNG